MRRLPARPRSKQSRLAAELFGRRGETLAAWFLRLKGYRILASRFKTPMGEIDLVAQRFGTLVFVEVKARRSGSLADAWLAVNDRRIARAAGYFLARHPRYAASDLRYDVIFLAPMTWPRHVVNAFDAPHRT
ncbi:MAG: YraN family protein [Devosia sp.]